MFEVAQAGQAFAANGGAGLYLDGDHPAIGGFQDGVYLDLVPGAIVVKARAFPGPGGLAASSITTDVSTMGPAPPSCPPRRAWSWPARRAAMPVSPKATAEEPVARSSM